MADKATGKLKPWEDRWQQPDPQVLLGALEEHRQKFVTTLMEQIGAYDGLKATLRWHGDSWKWCWQFDLTQGNGEPRPFAYLVPNPQGPLLCITLDDDLVNQLPLRRLSRYIRDGIRQAKAKCAVKTHWATWSPNAMTEVEQLLDLVKRKHRLLTQPKK